MAESPEEPSKVVLVVDDSDSDRRAITELLTRAGFTVRALASSIGATRAAREAGAGVAVIELNLPELHGGKLAALFRANPNLKDLKLILMSSHDETMMADFLREARGDAFVRKDRLQTELVPAVRRLFGD